MSDALCVSCDDEAVARCINCRVPLCFECSDDYDGLCVKCDAEAE